MENRPDDRLIHGDVRKERMLKCKRGKGKQSGDKPTSLEPRKAQGKPHLEPGTLGGFSPPLPAMMWGEKEPPTDIKGILMNLI